VNLADAAAGLTEFWSQRVVASGNGNLFEVAKGIGSTNWHRHDDQDEVFLVIEGRITIQLRDGNVELGAGDLFVVPRGAEHCPVAHEEARFLVVGPEVTSNAAGGKPSWSYTDASENRPALTGAGVGAALIVPEAGVLETRLLVPGGGVFP